MKTQRALLATVKLLIPIGKGETPEGVWQYFENRIYDTGVADFAPEPDEEVLVTWDDTDEAEMTLHDDITIP